jgi:hypothetical protein
MVWEPCSYTARSEPNRAGGITYDPISFDSPKNVRYLVVIGNDEKCIYFIHSSLSLDCFSSLPFPFVVNSGYE